MKNRKCMICDDAPGQICRARAFHRCGFTLKLRRHRKKLMDFAYFVNQGILDFISAWEEQTRGNLHKQRHREPCCRRITLCFSPRKWIQRCAQELKRK
jgi:hypothetical protein